jgi:hypothetical protein
MLCFLVSGYSNAEVRRITLLLWTGQCAQLFAKLGAEFSIEDAVVIAKEIHE